ncbi:MAG: hypothetical protein U9P14_05770 [Gemmatimonadota bacterium]|nr:hypothetical protein [Gemmatimonadota bacterium]
MGKSNGRTLEILGWISLYIAIITIPFFPPYTLALLVFGGIVATHYHSRHR